MSYLYLFILYSNIWSLVWIYWELAEFDIVHNFNCMAWFKFVVWICFTLIIFDTIRCFFFSKIKFKKKKLNPRFWLLYIKTLPVVWFLVWFYYSLMLEKFTKKDFYNIVILNILYWFIAYLYAFISNYQYFPIIYIFDILAIILFFILWIWDIIYTKFILKNKESLK